MTRLKTVEWRVLTGSLYTVHAVHDLFTRHRLELMARSVGPYSEEIVQDFYASYVATLCGALDKKLNSAKHDPLKKFMVKGCRVDISPTTIRRFLYAVPTPPPMILLI